MTIRPLLDRTAAHAAAYLDGLEAAPVAATATLAELRAALGRPLTANGVPAEQVVDELVGDVGNGLIGSAGGRFFGWVIGGGLPAALAADWLTSTWDQNAGLYACGPAAAVAEEVAGAWLRELLGIPDGASFACVTGCQMAHVTALAAARHALLARRGIEVERAGLAGTPPIRLLATRHRHVTFDRAARLLGLGSDRIEIVASDDAGRLVPDDLDRLLAAEPEAPALVCLQAGDVNSGLVDPLEAGCRVAHERGAWVHVDGAFGLWAAASPRLRQLVAGHEQADSWATDAHKWLNVPYDSGIAFCAHPDAHRAAMTVAAGYLTQADGARDQADWTPELSRRARGFAIYAALRSLGRDGVAELVERCVRLAGRIVDEVGALEGVEVVARGELNQGLVRFLADDGGDDDAWTDAVIGRIQADGETFFGPTTWEGQRAMRVSVSGWRTTDADVDRVVAAVRRVLAAPA